MEIHRKHNFYDDSPCKNLPNNTCDDSLGVKRRDNISQKDMKETDQLKLYLC